MGLPLDLLVSGESRYDDQILVAGIEDGVVLWGPHQAVDGFTALDNLGSHHATSGPGLDLAVLTRGREGAFITPSDANDGGLVSLGHVLLDSAGLRDQLEGAIGAGERQDLLGALGGRAPVHSEDWLINFHDLAFLKKPARLVFEFS